MRGEGGGNVGMACSTSRGRGLHWTRVLTLLARARGLEAAAREGALGGLTVALLAGTTCGVYGMRVGVGGRGRAGGVVG